MRKYSSNGIKVQKVNNGEALMPDFETFLHGIYSDNAYSTNVEPLPKADDSELMERPKGPNKNSRYIDDMFSRMARVPELVMQDKVDEHIEIELVQYKWNAPLPKSKDLYFNPSHKTN